MCGFCKKKYRKNNHVKIVSLFLSHYLCKDFHNEEKGEKNKSKSEFIFASFPIEECLRIQLYSTKYSCKPCAILVLSEYPLNRTFSYLTVCHNRPIKILSVARPLPSMLNLMPELRIYWLNNSLIYCAPCQCWKRLVFHDAQRHRGWVDKTNQLPSYRIATKR